MFHKIINGYYYQCKEVIRIIYFLSELLATTVQFLVFPYER